MFNIFCLSIGEVRSNFLLRFWKTTENPSWLFFRSSSNFALPSAVFASSSTSLNPSGSVIIFGKILLWYARLSALKLASWPASSLSNNKKRCSVNLLMSFRCSGVSAVPHVATQRWYPNLANQITSICPSTMNNALCSLISCFARFNP